MEASTYHLALAACVGAALAALVCVRLRGGPEAAGEAADVVMKQVGEPRGGHVRFSVSRLPQRELLARGRRFAALVDQRRSCRFFSTDAVPLEAIKNAVRAAGSAPSGAHKQPWTFCVVRSSELKKRLREVVEAAEQVNYDRRMRSEWKDDIKGIMHGGDGVVGGLHGGDADAQIVTKPYLTDAPYIVVLMKHAYAGRDDQGRKRPVYYASESAGIAAGLFIAALQTVGLVTLTSTPMGAEKAISQLLGRPENEKVYLLLPVGFAASDATVPYRASLPEKGAELLRKPLADIMTLH